MSRHQPQIEDTLKTASTINDKTNKQTRQRIIFSYRKSKIRKNSRTKPEEDSTLPREQQREELHPTSSPQKARKQKESGVRYLKSWEERKKQNKTKPTLEFCTLWNDPSEVREKCFVRQTKIEGIGCQKMLPQKKSFREEENNIGQKCGSKWRKGRALKKE